MVKDSEWDRKHKLFDPWTPLGEVKSTRMLTMLMMMIWEVIYNSYDKVIYLKLDQLRMLRSQGKAAGQTHTSKTDHVLSRHTPEKLQTQRAKWERKRGQEWGKKTKSMRGQSEWGQSFVALQSSLTDHSQMYFQETYTAVGSAGWCSLLVRFLVSSGLFC